MTAQQTKQKEHRQFSQNLETCALVKMFIVCFVLLIELGVRKSEEGVRTERETERKRQRVFDDFF